MCFCKTQLSPHQPAAAPCTNSCGGAIPVPCQRCAAFVKGPKPFEVTIQTTYPDTSRPNKYKQIRYWCWTSMNTQNIFEVCLTWCILMPISKCRVVVFFFCGFNVFARLCVAFGLDPFPCILLCSSSLGLGSDVKDIWFGSCDPSRLSGITLKGSKAKTRTERLRPSPPSDAYRSWISFGQNVLLASWPDMWHKGRWFLRGSDSEWFWYP